MIRKYILPLVALAGVMFAVYTVIRGRAPMPVAPPVAQPSSAPFASYVAGAGIIEPSTESIAIGTPVGNIVTGIFVKVGDHVKQGQPLFRLEDDVMAAQLDIRKAALDAANARLRRLQTLPRPEDIPPAEAKVKEAAAALADARRQLQLYESVNDRRAISQDEVVRRRGAVDVAEAHLASAQADLTLLKAGSWAPDLAIAQAEVLSARAAVKEAEAEVHRRTIRAPIDGQVLQVKVRLGEYAQPGPLATPLMLLGGTDWLHVRVDVDENDAWRINPEARAVASVRGNSQLKTALNFVRIEPFVVPKKSLTGESTERVDTRVLQVIYRFQRGNLPVYVGQQMDVFIEAPSLRDAGRAPATRPAEPQ